jgi:RimJ/RimL family protein N-acetyltransferase
MIDITRLSSRYKIRTLTDSDVDVILDLCQHNTLFYEYTEARPAIEEIRNDMRITPPGITLSDKYFFGFFEGQELVAVMDLIDGYPKPESAYIGFFMMNQEYQGQQIGSAIIGDTAGYLRKIGKTAIRLAIDKGNPQSAHFWKKNGFKVILEVDVNGWTKLVAEKSLRER